jgi:hypothetical protein
MAGINSIEHHGIILVPERMVSHELGEGLLQELLTVYAIVPK